MSSRLVLGGYVLDRSSYTYLCRSEEWPLGMVKIGHTRSPDERMWGLHAKRIFCVVGGEPLERQLHGRFMAGWLRGEYFRASREMVAVFTEIADLEIAAGLEPLIADAVAVNEMLALCARLGDPVPVPAAELQWFVESGRRWL